MKMKALYELPIGARLTQKELAAHLCVHRRIAGQSSSPTPLLSRSSSAYVNLHKVPMTGTSVAESLNMRNLTRFLWLGIARLMGKKTSKRDNTISYQTLRLNVDFPPLLSNRLF